MHKTTVAIEDVPEAAVLAEPVLDVHQQVLLSAGTLLTPARLDSLRQRGVTRLVIVAAAPDAVESLALQAQTDERLQYLFRHALQAGQVNPLLHMVARYRQGGSP
ncbi:hypothetical protein J2X19_004597 [Rhodoferax ferrireducens]|uniref:Uncharacterized protein n=1 Tax=Rhodoferax ferrireducens TaxID=192843 RepID=A0ABU2CF06_9BURK|nr:hypothetical protein [Rhodoferax ferrireducens]MDR7379901.1 hypothetical protein [Rhodoferax ferrireducens]